MPSKSEQKTVVELSEGRTHDRPRPRHIHQEEDQEDLGSYRVCIPSSISPRVQSVKCLADKMETVSRGGEYGSITISADNIRAAETTPKAKNPR